jgi:hypothetical protein
VEHLDGWEGTSRHCLRPEISRSRAAEEGRGARPILILAAMALDKPQDNQGIGQDADSGTGFNSHQMETASLL